MPQYLLDRAEATNAKAMSTAIKNKRLEKAAKFSVPLPKVRGIAEEEMFKVQFSGKKTAKKSWKRMVTKPTCTYKGLGSERTSVANLSQLLAPTLREGL